MLETNPFKKKSFHRKIIACIIVVLSIHLIIIAPYEETKAVTPLKIMSFITQKQAKKSISFLVEKKAKETVKDITVKAARVPPSRHKAGLYSPRSPKKGMTRYEWQQTRNGKTTTKTYDVKDPDTWTDNDYKKLNSSIEDLIKIRLAQGEWTFFHTLTDFLFDWSLIAGGTLYITSKLRGTEQEELENLTYYSLLESGLISPVYDTTTGGHAYTGATGTFGEVSPSKWYEIDPLPENEVEPLPEEQVTFDFTPASLDLLQDKGIEINNNTNPNVTFNEGYSQDSWTFKEKINPQLKDIRGATIVIDFNGFFNQIQEKIYMTIGLFNESDYSNYNYTGASITNNNMISEYQDYTSVSLYASNENKIELGGLQSLLFNGVEIETATNEHTLFPPEYITHFKTMDRIIIHVPKEVGDYMEVVVESSEGVSRAIKEVVSMGELYNYDTINVSFEYASIVPEIAPNIHVRTYFTNVPEVYRDTEPIPTRHDVDIKTTELEDPEKQTVTLPTPNNIPVSVPGHDEMFYVTPTNDGKLTLRGEQSGEEPDIEEGQEEELVIGNPKYEPEPDTPYPEMERPPDPSEPGEGSGGEGEGGGSGEGEDGASCVVNRDFDGFKELGETFTTKFPFSIPFDIYRLFEAVFGDMGSERPHFVYPVGNTEFEIGIPAYFDEWMPFARSMLLIIFDIGLIYAVRKMMGGNQG